MSNYKLSKHKFIPDPEPELRDEICVLRWDYKGHRRSPNEVQWLQTDWNQTLMTNINLCASWLNQHFNRDDELLEYNTITTNSSCAVLLEDMNYFQHIVSLEMTNPRTIGILMGRFIVNINDSENNNKIYLGTLEQPKLGLIIVDRLGL